MKGLYVITKDNLPIDAVAQAIAGGAIMVQYRNKTAPYHQQLSQAQELCQLCRRHNVPLIINDNINLAQEVNAAGVHLGKDDAGIAKARNLLGKQAIIGISCYDNLTTAINGEKNGADYVAFGRFFPSKTKPYATPAPLSLLSQAKKVINIPLVAIGGITADNCTELITQGADMLAVIDGVFGQKDIKFAARTISSKY